MQKSLFSTLYITILFPVLSFGTIIYTDHSSSSDSLTIGDRIDLRISVVHSSDEEIVGPETDDEFGDFVVKQWHDERITRDNSDSTAFFYTVTTYKTGLCTIPALPFYVTKDTIQDTLYSRPIALRIASVISADTAVIRDIKPPLVAGRGSWWWLWSILAVALVAGGGVLGRHLVLRGRKPPPPPPPKPPYDEAMEALAALNGKELIKKGLIREHIFELSEILKRYMGRRYETPAAEYTTEEILAWLSEAPFSDKLKDSMVWFFETSHPVKFARLIPTQDNLQSLCERAQSFIKQTKPTPEENKKPSAAEVKA